MSFNMIDWMHSHLIIVLGRWCVGKDSVLEELCRIGVAKIPTMRTNRSLRDGEIEGRDLIPANRNMIRFAKYSERAGLLGEFVANAGISDREQVVGIPLEPLMRAKDHNQLAAMICYPNFVQYFEQIDPLIFIITATEEDQDRMYAARGLSRGFNHRLGIEQNIAGGWSDNLFLPGHSTFYVQNVWGDPGIAAAEILRTVCTKRHCS